MTRTDNRLRKDAISIFRAGLAAVEPVEAVRSHLILDGSTLLAGEDAIPLPDHGRILVLGAGKAAAPMAAALEKLLGKRITQSLHVVKYGHLYPVERSTIIEAGHPVPDRNGLDGSRRILETAQSAEENDLVICLLSGGGSALLPCPAPPVTLEEKQETTRLLLASGASIGEVNAIRKHLSLIKGGGLAKAVYPARLLTLILSDVVGDPLDVIASGPTVPDPTTFQDALEIINSYGLRDKAPLSVVDRLVKGSTGGLTETPKEGSPEFEKTLNIIVANNDMALAAAHVEAKSLGYNASIIPYPVEGEAREEAEAHLEKVRDIISDGYPVAPPACLISGGETTVTLAGNGKGGRNLEYALASAIGLEGLDGVVLLSAGTDGTDGPTDAAGAIIDSRTTAKARAAGLDPGQYLENNDSYTFFEATGELFKTGPTLTNVMDIQIVVVSGQAGVSQSTGILKL